MSYIDDFGLKNKNILITGASSGLGRAIAIGCSEAGANLALVGRNQSELELTLSKLKDGNHQCYSCDVTDTGSFKDLFGKITKDIGPLSGLVHSAGIELSLPLKASSAMGYRNVFDVNTIAAFELSRFLLMRKNRAEQVSIVFLTSIMAIVGAPAQIAYAASKGALLAASRCVALEYADKDVRFNCISPGFVSGTNMSNELMEKLPKEAKEKLISSYPLGLGSPTDISNASIFLLSNASKWITGTNIVVDGGYSAQ